MCGNYIVSHFNRCSYLVIFVVSHEVVGVPPASDPVPAGNTIAGKCITRAFRGGYRMRGLLVAARFLPDRVGKLP